MGESLCLKGEIMSRDDTILVYDVDFGNHRKWYVVQLQAVENVLFESESADRNGPKVQVLVDHNAVLRLEEFGNRARSYNNRNAAMCTAIVLFRQDPWCEYGIKVYHGVR